MEIGTALECVLDVCGSWFWCLVCRRGLLPGRTDQRTVGRGRTIRARPGPRSRRAAFRAWPLERRLLRRRRGHLILHLLGRHRQQGMEMLTQLWQQFPLNSTVTVFYNRATGAEKHKTPAQQAVSQEIERYNLTWNVFWDTGSGFNKKNTVAIQIKKKTEQWNISGKLPTNTKRLRLDPPNTLPFRLSQIKLQIDGAEFDISLDEVKLNMMSREHNWIVFYSGVDPHFYFNVDQYMQLIEQDAADISITFSMVPVES